MQEEIEYIAEETSESTKEEEADNPQLKEEYAELVRDFKSIAQRGIGDYQEGQDGREIEYCSLSLSGRYGIIVKTDEKGIPTIQLTDIDEDNQGRPRQQRFAMGLRSEVSTKDKAYKSCDLLGRLDTVVKEYDVTAKAHDLLKDAIVDAQNKGEKKQKDIDENDKQYFDPLQVEGSDSSLFMGSADMPDLNLMKSLVVSGRQMVKKHLGAKLDKVEVLLYCVWDTMEFADTQGSGVDNAISRVGYSIMVKTKDGSEAFRAIRGAGGGLEVLKKYEEDKCKSLQEIVKDLAETVSKEASDLDKAQSSSIIGTSCPVILSSEVTGVFVHESLGHPMESDIILENKESKNADVNLKTRIGGQVIENSNISIRDSGMSDIILGDKIIPSGWGTIPIDEHGTLPSETVLVDKGVQTGVMLSRYDINEIVDGLKDDVASGIKDIGLTGNVRSENYSKNPMVRMTNTYMMPNPNGPKTLEDMAKKVPSNKKGLYVHTCKGGWVEPNTGEFQIICALAYLIENGQIVYRKPIKNARINGNITKLSIKEVGGVGTVNRSFEGFCGKSGSWVPTEGVGPSVLIEDAKVISSPFSYTSQYRDYSKQLQKVKDGIIKKEEVYIDCIGESLDNRDNSKGDSHHNACMVVLAMEIDDEINYVTGKDIGDNNG